LTPPEKQFIDDMASKKKTTPTNNKVESKQTIEKSTPVFQPVDLSSYILLALFKDHWLKLLIISALAGGIYFASVNFGYVLDDAIVIEDNDFTKKGFGGITDHLTSESMEGYFGKQMNLVPGNRYRPLSLVTFAMEYGVTGKLSPGLSHFINIVFYLLTGWLLFLVLQLIAQNAPKWETSFSAENKTAFAFIATLLYIAHPLHVEVVANIKGRDELMAMLFSIWALYFFYKDGLNPQRKHLIIGGVLYFLALLSKENAITFLAIVPLTVYFFIGRNTFRSIPTLIGVTILYLMWRFSVSGVPDFGAEVKDIMNNPFVEMNPGEKLATVFYTLGLYIKLLIFPHPLTHDYYPYAIPIMNFGKLGTLVSFALYIGLIVIAFKYLKQRKIASYGILFYLITLSIVSNLVINVGTFMNDRFVYMPSLGYCILLAAGLVFVYKKFVKSENNILLYSLAALPILAYAGKSFVRVPDWENALTLNKSTFPASENSARANSFMATALFEEYKVTEGLDKRRKLIEEAHPYAIKAQKILPTFHNANVMVAGVAAERYNLTGDLDAFLSDFHKVAIIRPDIQTKQKPDGKLHSYLTEYLEYINGKLGPDPKLVNFYRTTVKDMSLSQDVNIKLWGRRLAEMGLQVAPGDPELMRLQNALR